MTEEILKIASPPYFQNNKWYSSTVLKQLLEKKKLKFPPTRKSHKTKYTWNMNLEKKTLNAVVLWTQE